MQGTTSSINCSHVLTVHDSAIVFFAVNAILTQRMIRALHPNFGWSPLLNGFFLFHVYSIPFIMIYNILFTVAAFYTLDADLLYIIRACLLFGLCYSLFASVLPVLFIALGILLPCSAPIERFGTGRPRSKVAILLFATLLLLAGAVVRLASFAMDHPVESPGMLESKYIFYIIGFAFELTAVVLYAVIRIDKRFWVPDGAKGPGDYSGLHGESHKFFQELHRKNSQGTYSYQGFLEANWFGRGSPVTKPTREQVRTIIQNLGFPAEIVGMPMDCGDEEEILLYTFRVRKTATRQKIKRKMARQSSWSCDTAVEYLG